MHHRLVCRLIGHSMTKASYYQSQQRSEMRNSLFAHPIVSRSITSEPPRGHQKLILLNDGKSNDICEYAATRHVQFTFTKITNTFSNLSSFRAFEKDHNSFLHSVPFEHAATPNQHFQLKVDIDRFLAIWVLKLARK